MSKIARQLDIMDDAAGQASSSRITSGEMIVAHITGSEDKIRYRDYEDVCVRACVYVCVCVCVCVFDADVQSCSSF